MNVKNNTSHNLASSVPFILLASDNSRGAEHLHRILQQEGFRVRVAPTYSDLEHHDFEQRDSASPSQHQHVLVLLEVSSLQSVEAAIAVAIRLKRRNAGQFVGYIVDPILHTSGLAGDAIFPRSPHHLPQALRDFFHGEPIPPG